MLEPAVGPHALPGSGGLAPALAFWSLLVWKDHECELGLVVELRAALSAARPVADGSGFTFGEHARVIHDWLEQRKLYSREIASAVLVYVLQGFPPPTERPSSLKEFEPSASAADLPTGVPTFRFSFRPWNLAHETEAAYSKILLQEINAAKKAYIKDAKATALTRGFPEKMSAPAFLQHCEWLIESRCYSKDLRKQAAIAERHSVDDLKRIAHGIKTAATRLGIARVRGAAGPSPKGKP